MSEVNYSSARVGLGEERDVWRMLQNFIAMRFCREVYHRWLKSSLLVGKFELSSRDYEQVRNPIWRPRGWRYVDPQKEIAANIDAIANNLATYTNVLAEQGVDLEEFLATKQAERELFAKYGVEYDILKATAPASNPDAGDGPDAAAAPPTDGETAASRGYVNGEFEH
jgi:capsid protein